MTQSVRSTTDPFAPPLAFPAERFRRVLGEDVADRLGERFAGFDYPTARTWSASVRGVHEDDLRARFAVPEGATLESLTERLRDDLVELAVAVGAENVSGTKDELGSSILATVPEPVTPPAPEQPVGDPAPAPAGEPAPTPEGEQPADVAQDASAAPAPAEETPEAAPAAPVASDGDEPVGAVQTADGVEHVGEIPAEAAVPVDADSAPVEAADAPVADSAVAATAAPAAKRSRS